MSVKIMIQSGVPYFSADRGNDISKGQKFNAANYAAQLSIMIDELKTEYGYSELDAFLVLKDILANVWKSRKE